MRSKRLAVALTALSFFPNLAWAQAATTTTGSQACATIVQAAADGMNARIQADDTTINPPKSVKQLSCLNSFFNGVGLNVITNILNPANLLTAVEGQICNVLTSAWNQTLGSAQCGLTVTGFNIGIGGLGGLGGGEMCPRLSFGGGGPPLGSIGTSGTNAGTSSGVNLYMNSVPTAPVGYSPISTIGSY
jgi:hypothetical protein